MCYYAISYHVFKTIFEYSTRKQAKRRVSSVSIVKSMQAHLIAPPTSRSQQHSKLPPASTYTTNNQPLVILPHLKHFSTSPHMGDLWGFSLRSPRQHSQSLSPQLSNHNLYPKSASLTLSYTLAMLRNH